MSAVSPMTTNQTVASLWHKRWLKWFGVLTLAGVMLASIAWQTRERWLSGAAQAWVVNDPVERADAVMVLGGGAQFRSFEAARMYREGLASKVLFPGPQAGPGGDEQGDQL